MSAPAAERTARNSTRATAKFEARRAQLAASAIVTLAETGYANTSLRDIAQNSDFSHGVLHYYFDDKLDLIIYCVRQYKAACVLRYDEVLATSRTADQLKKGFVRLLGETLVEDASFHRLWYDLRAQSLFEQPLRKDALDIDATLDRMVWRIVSRFAELSDREVGVAQSVAYAVFDGLFQRALLQHLSGDPRAVASLRKQASDTLDLVLTGRPPV
jgi:AcrR family transcriptional regulator